MAETEDIVHDVSNSVRDALSALITAEALIVKELNDELSFFIKLVSLTVTSTIVNLIDSIFYLYPDEWRIVDTAIIGFGQWLNDFAYQEARAVNKILEAFTTVSNSLINKVADSLDVIDELIGPKYNKRMFAIYDRIAVFSQAIGAPPAYLESVIQNARSFVMTISCFGGSSYYDFLSTWDSGVEQLLIRISRYTALYRENPQLIKTDVEIMLIKPAYDLMLEVRQNESAALTNFEKRIDKLINSTVDLQLQIVEIKEAADNRFINEIDPRLRFISEAMSDWRDRIYRTEMGTMLTALKSISLSVTRTGLEIADIFGLLDYGGDLLLRINDLDDNIRQDQEDKIANVSNRSFARIVPGWLSTVKEKTE